MAYQLRITVEQLADNNEIMSVSQKVFSGYTDVTDANLHNLAIERALLKTHSELAVIKAGDEAKAGRAMTDLERMELGLE